MKRKTKLISFLLILTLSFGCIIAPYYGQQIYAKALENEFDEEFDQLANSYLTGNDISDEYIDEQTEEITQQYIEYVHFDDNNASKRKLIIDETPIDMKYGAIIYEEEIDISEQIENEEDAYNIAVIRMIHKNVNAMNQMVEEELGYINDDYEFEFNETDESYARWRMNKPIWSWNCVRIPADSDWAIFFASFFLFFKTAFNTVVSCMEAFDSLKTKYEQLADKIQYALFYVPNDIATQMVAFFSNTMVSSLIGICSWVLQVVSSTHPFLRALFIIVDICTPSLLDCIVILYNAALNRSINVKICWIPTWWDNWGISIQITQ